MESNEIPCEISSFIKLKLSLSFFTNSVESSSVFFCPSLIAIKCQIPLPLESVCFPFCLASTSCFTTDKWLLVAASNKAVRCEVSFNIGSAPAFSRSLTLLTWPFSAAAIKAEWWNISSVVLISAPSFKSFCKTSLWPFLAACISAVPPSPPRSKALKCIFAPFKRSISTISRCPFWTALSKAVFSEISLASMSAPCLSSRLTISRNPFEEANIKAVSFQRFILSTFAPRSSRNVAISKKPLSAETINGVLPIKSAVSSSAVKDSCFWCWKISFTISVSPVKTADINGVCPLAFCTAVFAPRSSRIRAVSICFSCIARANAVSLFTEM